MFNDTGFIDLRNMPSSLEAVVQTRNSEYVIREKNGIFALRGGKFESPVSSDLAPYIVGIGAPMFFADIRTSRVQSVMVRAIPTETKEATA